MHMRILQQMYRRRKCRRTLIISISALILIYFIDLMFFNVSSDFDSALFVEEGSSPIVPPFEHLIPPDPFELYWIMWNTDRSTFRNRHLLVLESLFIHHPQATVIMLSRTLDDRKLFLPFRHRGYRIHLFRISLRHLVQWRWYSNNQTRDFLRYWNSSGTYFYSHFTDYVRTIAMYLYGGTYLDMDALILQPLPNEEFIGYDQIDPDEQCDWCVGNASDLYLAPAVMRFRSHRRILQHILEETFDRRLYNSSCLNCVGSIPYTRYIIEGREKKDSEVMNLKLLEPYRLYPYRWTQATDIFYNVQQDTPLELADLMKRSYSLHLFGHVTNQLDIAQGSLIDLLLDQYDLGDLRLKTSNPDRSNNHVRLICPQLYIYISRKQGRFIGRDGIYLRLNETFGDENVRWTITIAAFNGSVIVPPEMPMSNLNQAQINRLLNELKYEPFESTSTDQLTIDMENENVFVSCSLTILIFSRWVTMLTKTMGTSDRWPAIRRLAASIDRYFPQTTILIASDSRKAIDKTAFLHFMSSIHIQGYNSNKTMVIYNLPEDSGLSKSRNYLVNKTMTPFFFLLDDDFEFEEDSHLDMLLELIYTYSHIDIIAGKIPEDIRNYKDFSGVFLRYGQTLELAHDVSDDRRNEILFSQSDKGKINDGNPCRQVDFVPNVFMGRTESFDSVRWDDDLKVGEHEDFFLRFREANRNVYSCRYIHVHHRQKPWWLETNGTYYKKRTRAYQYFEKVLRKHEFRRLIVFEYVHIDLNKNCSGTCYD